MVPNYKRPSVQEYFYDTWETAPTDQDLDMLVYMVNCERNSKILDKVLEYPCFTEECPLTIFDNEEVKELCNCENCNDTYKECWLKYYGKDIPLPEGFGKTLFKEDE